MEVQRGGGRYRIHDREDRSVANRGQQERRIPAGIATWLRSQLHPQRKTSEGRFVRGHVKPPAPGSAVLSTQTSVSIMSGERDDPSGSRELVPFRERRYRAIEERCERRCRSNQITEQRALEREPFLVPPLAVRVHPLDSIERHGPIGPRELAPRRKRMRGDTKPAQAGNVLRNRVAVTTQRVGRLTNSDSDV